MDDLAIALLLASVQQKSRYFEVGENARLYGTGSTAVAGDDPAGAPSVAPEKDQPTSPDLDVIPFAPRLKPVGCLQPQRLAPEPQHPQTCRFPE